MIIENRPGAGGNIGVDAVAKAAPDGLTIGIAAVATHAINPWLYSKMPYDAASDLRAITQMVRVPNVLVMNADTARRLNINTLADLIAYAKANPAKLNYGSGGNGSAGHLAGEMFKSQAGIFAVHIPYNGGNPAQLALLSGQVDFNFDNLATASRQHQGRQAQGAGRHHRQPQRLPARRAGRGRNAQGLCDRHLVGPGGPAATPTGRGRQTEPGLRRGAECARDQGPLQHPDGRTGGQLARAVRGLHEERTGEV